MSLTEAQWDNLIAEAAAVLREREQIDSLRPADPALLREIADAMCGSYTAGYLRLDMYQKREQRSSQAARLRALADQMERLERGEAPNVVQRIT